MGKVNVLISSAGRRVALMDCFRRTMRSMELSGRLLAVDCSRASSAFHSADAAWQVPRCTDEDFISTIADLCMRNSVGLVVPTIDTELSAYAMARSALVETGARVCISDVETIRIAEDKRCTHEWLARCGFPTVWQTDARAFLGEAVSDDFPLIVKPARGSASAGVQTVNSVDELRILCRQGPDLIIQEIAPGQEYTVHCYVNTESRCLCAVPHKRLEVRAGEVSKAIIVQDSAIIDLARRIAEALPGAYGVVTIQIFAYKDILNVIEINPRLGGGYPLAYEAGADYPRWLIDEARGVAVTERFEEWQDNLCMLRYDAAVFVTGDAI